MAHKIHYCKTWFRGKRIPIDLLSEDEARSRHISGTPYAALIGSESKPFCFVEFLIDKGMVGVGFYDGEFREYLTYQFHCVSVNKLFLKWLLIENL